MTLLKETFRDKPVTMSLLGLLVLVFTLMNLFYPFRATSNEAIFTFGGLLGLAIELDPSQWWRLLTSNLVHIGFQHLLMNAFSLYIVGRIAEQLWQPRFYLTLFTLSGVFGGLLTILLAPQVLSAGASSSIFGLFAGVAVLGYFGKSPFLKQMGRSFQTMILINLVFNLFSPDINIWGHLGGAIGGGLCAVFLPNQVWPRPFSRAQQVQALLAFVGLSLAMLALFYLF